MLSILLKPLDPFQMTKAGSRGGIQLLVHGAQASQQVLASRTVSHSTFSSKLSVVSSVD